VLQIYYYNKQQTGFSGNEIIKAELSPISAFTCYQSLVTSIYFITT